MNQLHSDLQATVVAPVPSSVSSPATSSPRLVVVMREAEEEALLAGRIHELAQARRLPVMLVGIARDPAVEAELRRSLVTIAAFLTEADAHAGLALRRSAPARAPEIQIECGRDWMNKIRTLLRSGDMLACYSEQTTGMLERPLSDVLSGGLNMPIYMFAGLRTERPRRRNVLAQAASWTGSLASIGGFLFLQARIVTMVQGWVQSVLLLVTLLAEVGVVWVVNSVSGQF